MQEAKITGIDQISGQTEANGRNVISQRRYYIISSTEHLKLPVKDHAEISHLRKWLIGLV